MTNVKDQIPKFKSMSNVKTVISKTICILFSGAFFSPQNRTRCGKGNLNPFFIKSILDPSPQLPPYLPLFQWDGLYHHTDDQLGFSKFLYPQDL